MGSGVGKSKRTRSSAGSGPPNDKHGWTLEETYGDDDVIISSRVSDGAVMHQLVRGNGALLMDATRKDEGREVNVYPNAQYSGVDMAARQDAFVDALSGAFGTWHFRDGNNAGPAGANRSSVELFRSTWGDSMTCRVTDNGINVEAVTRWHNDGGDVDDDGPRSGEDIIESEVVNTYSIAEAAAILWALGDAEEREEKIKEMKDRVLRVDPDSVGRVGF